MTNTESAMHLNLTYVVSMINGIINIYTISKVPSVLWRCRLGGRKGIRPVKNWVVGCWRGYLSAARCRLAHGQLMPMPLTVSCFSKIQIGFIFLVPAHLGSPGQRDVKRVCQKNKTLNSCSSFPPNGNRFSKFFHWLSGKFATKAYLNITPHLKYVATLPCEIWMSG